MNKSKETNDLIKRYEDSACILSVRERTLFDICKSLAIIADKLTEENFSVKDATDLEGYSTRLWKKAYDRGWKEVLEKVRAEIGMYEADCRLQGGTDECEKCNSNVFGSIYRIIDKYKTEREGKQ